MELQQQKEPAWHRGGKVREAEKASWENGVKKKFSVGLGKGDDTVSENSRA